MGKLEGKVAIVTGAGQGIGRGIAVAFAKEGARVVVAEINPKTANAVAEEIRQLGQKALALVCDVGNENQVKKMIDQAVKEFGPIDILVNNAQSWGPKDKRPDQPPVKPLEEFPEDWWDNTFQTGLKGTFYCCKAVFPHMKDRGGKIINFGSEAGYHGRPGCVDYNCCKEAIRAFTRTAAREWGSYKINSNTIVPAAETESMRAFRAAYPKKEKIWRERLPLQRWGDPEKDLGRVAVFLASEDSDYLTGKTFEVDGGSIMKP